MKRYYVVYSGQVQGVGFRWYLMNIANSLSLTGYVRNLSNGNVEAEVQGERVDEFIKESTKDHFYIMVSDYEYKDMPLVKNEKKFSVRF